MAPPGAAARSAAALAAGRLHALFSADARDIRSRRGREAPRLRGARRALEFDQRAAASALRRRSCGSQRCRGIRAQPSAVGAHAAPALRVARVARSIADAPHADSCGGSCRGHLRGRAGWGAHARRGAARHARCSPCAHCLCPSPARSASRRPRAPPSSRHPRGPRHRTASPSCARAPRLPNCPLARPTACGRPGASLAAGRMSSANARRRRDFFPTKPGPYVGRPGIPTVPCRKLPTRGQSRYSSTQSFRNTRVREQMPRPALLYSARHPSPRQASQWCARIGSVHGSSGIAASAANLAARPQGLSHGCARSRSALAADLGGRPRRGACTVAEHAHQILGVAALVGSGVAEFRVRTPRHRRGGHRVRHRARCGELALAVPLYRNAEEAGVALSAAGCAYFAGTAPLRTAGAALDRR